MNWAKENKFLTGFLIVMLIGVGVLGYLVYSASAACDEASNQYAAKSSEYSRLRHLAPYPNKKVLDAFVAQKTEAAGVISAFQADLAKREFPVEPISPETFQDRLKAAVSAVRTKATEAGVKLQDKFFLGFETYEGRPPASEAAAPLGRQLKAIEWVVNQLVASRITELKDLKRPELPEEKKGGGSGGGAKKPGDKGGGERPGKGRQDLVARHPFDIVLICRQQVLANALNVIIGAKAPQFYVPRILRIKNEKDKGPSRAEDAGAEPGKTKYIVGEELIEVTLRLEMVDVAEVAAK